MTLDKSLKVRAGAIKARNVLTRAERLKRLKELDKWKEGDALVGMPKVRVLKVSLKKKKKVKTEEDKEVIGFGCRVRLGSPLLSNQYCESRPTIRTAFCVFGVVQLRSVTRYWLTATHRSRWGQYWRPSPDEDC